AFGRGDLLIRIEGENAGRAERSHGAASPTRAERFARVLDYRQAKFARYFADRIYLARHAENVHRQKRLQRAASAAIRQAAQRAIPGVPALDQHADFARTKIQRQRINISEDGRSAFIERTIRGRDKTK